LDRSRSRMSFSFLSPRSAVHLKVPFNHFFLSGNKQTK
jgi:hypothetical protein